MKYILLVIGFFVGGFGLYYFSLQDYYNRIISGNEKHTLFLSGEVFVLNKDNAKDIASDYRRNFVNSTIFCVVNQNIFSIKGVDYQSFTPLFGNIAFDNNNIYRDGKRFVSYNKEFKVYPGGYLYDGVVMYYIPFGKPLFNIDIKAFEVFSGNFIANDKLYNGLYIISSGQCYFNGELISGAKVL